MEFQTPTGEIIVKKVRPRNLFMDNRICIYKPSTGERALRDFVADRKRDARHSPERAEIRDREGELIGLEPKGITGDKPRRRKHRKKRR